MGNFAHDFPDSLEIGQRGERIFYCLFKPQVKRLDGLVSDFELLDGRKIELKTDTYKMITTSNFFMERYSKDEFKSPGGPWQALGKSELFYYFFINDGIIFKFNTEELVARLNILVKNMSLINIGNKAGEGWITRGYKVPRKSLKDIYREHIIQDYENKKRNIIEGKKR